MGQITADQSQQVMALLSTNVDWSTIDFEALGLQDSVVRNATEAGRQFEAFLKNGCRLIVGDPKIINIDRTKSFDLAFIGKDWNIWKGPADGSGLEGEEEQDTCSMALLKVDLTKVRFETTLKSNETSVTGEERLKRLKKVGHIRLDIKVFQMLWENQLLIPESWKEKGYIFFDGTVLRYSNGRRSVLCLYWQGGAWSRSVRWLDGGRSANDPSAVLAG